LKTDSLGDTLWTRVYTYNHEIYGDLGELGNSVRQTPDGGYIITGAKHYSMAGTHNLWLLRTNSLGDTLWTRTYGEDGYQISDEGRCVQVTSDGGYIITGFTESYSSDGSTEMWLIKTDPDGAIKTDPDGAIVERFGGKAAVELITPVGSEVEFSYSGCAGGFHAEVFNSSGRKIDEIHRSESSGTVVWGRDRAPGVYFIRELGAGVTRKVVLVK